MPAPQAQGNKQWRPPGDVEDTIHVDLDESDSSKAVERVQESRGSLAVDTDDEESPAERKFLDHSKAVRKRIGRMQRNFEQKAADQAALFQRELAERDKRISALEARRETPTEVTDLEKEIQALEAQLVDAHEKGESKEVGRLTALIAKKNAQVFAVQQQKLAPTKDRERDPEHQQQQRAAPPGPTPRGQSWIDSNIDWWEDEDFAAERFEAVRLHDKMVAGGSDPNSPKHYKKLEEKLKVKFPKLQLAGASPDDDEDDEDEPPERIEPRREARRAPVQSIQDRGQGNGPKQRGRGVQLSADDIANMRKFGLDPQNNAHVLQYASAGADLE